MVHDRRFAGYQENERIRELCGVMKGVYERITESILRWFGHGERMQNDWIAVECAGSH